MAFSVCKYHEKISTELNTFLENKNIISGNVYHHDILKKYIFAFNDYIYKVYAKINT